MRIKFVKKRKTVQKKKQKVNGDWCAVIGCHNNRREIIKPNIIKPHVGLLKWHSPRDVEDAELWKKALKRGDDYEVKVKKTKVCSNHFSAGYYHSSCNVPTLFLAGHDEEEKKICNPLEDCCPPELDCSIDTSKVISSNSDKNSLEVPEITITEPILDHEYAITAS